MRQVGKLPGLKIIGKLPNIIGKLWFSTFFFFEISKYQCQSEKLYASYGKLANRQTDKLWQLPPTPDLNVLALQKKFEILIYRLIFRKVCQSLRTAVDNFGINFNSITCEFWEDSISIKLDDIKIVYSGDSIPAFLRVDKFTIGANFVEKALTDLEIVLKHVSWLTLEVYGKTAVNFIKSLRNTTVLHVKAISLKKFKFDDVLKILQYFDSQFLENIYLGSTVRVNQFERITLLDQWKNAKKIDFSRYGAPIEHLFHLEEFEISLENFSIEDAINIRDVSLYFKGIFFTMNLLQNLLKRSTFQKCEIHFGGGNRDEIGKVFKPDYLPYDDMYHLFEFQYSYENSIFEIKCEGGFNFIIKRC